ncbi:MAG: hypothetical protein PHN98_04220 [Smithellaceae bacterium]|nr:hypothetical protein [Smithellaceae bacterium]
MIREYWTKLDTRQRYLVAACAAVVIFTLLLKFVFFPLWDFRAKTKKSITNNSKKLNELVKIDAELSRQNAKMSRFKNAFGSRRSNFTLLSYLEKKAYSANVRGSITHMNSMQGVRSASFEETLTDLKLEKITIKQLADFIYQIEAPDELIRIKRITVEKMKENPDYINAQFIIASYMPAAPGPGGQ